MFVGGQTEKIKGRNGEYDVFSFYTGVGDTAVARAEFSIAKLTPDEVLADIRARSEHEKFAITVLEYCAALAEKPCGWSWTLENDTAKRCVKVVREFGFAEGRDRTERLIYTRPGYFDADVMTLCEGGAILRDFGYCVLYRGVRFVEGKTQVGFGVMVLDAKNPERVLYRSVKQIAVSERAGYTAAQDEVFPLTLDEAAAAAAIPQNVISEIRYMNRLTVEGRHWESHHTDWLTRRTAKYYSNNSNNSENSDNLDKER
jgi:hypothetical protein